MHTTFFYQWTRKVYHYLKYGKIDTDMWKLKFNHIGENTCVRQPLEIYSEGGKMYIGDNTYIHDYSRICNYVRGELDVEIRIGNNCHIGYYFTLLNASKVYIGDNVLFASHVFVTSENHGIDPESELAYVEQPLLASPVSIGDGCWIGEKVCILPGVNIGKKCIIGAGSVVTKSIPDYSIAVGNPARVIKRYNFENHSWGSIESDI